MIALGSNVGDRQAFLEFARNRLQEALGNLLASSAIIETEGFGVENHGPYLNQILGFETSLTPEQLIGITENIESEAGRTEKRSLKPRTLDIDILSLGQERINGERLTLPHKSMHLRPFVLEPLCEIFPDWQHPIFKKSASELLYELLNPGEEN